MTSRLGRYIFLAGFFIFVAGGLVWFVQRGGSKGVSQETPANAPRAWINSAVHQETSLEEAWSTAFQSDSVPRPTWKEVQDTRAYSTPRGKANYLQLLEGYGFRGAEAVPNFRTVLNDPDQEIRRAAMRGLGRTETAEAESILMSYAKDGVAIEESTEAALVLGQMGNSSVTGKLQELLRQAQDPVLREHLVDALAGRPWEQTQPFFSAHLRNQNVPLEEKQNALAMLGMRDTAPAGVLTGALGDSNEEVRAGAYQGLAWRNETMESAKVRSSLKRETDSGLRSLAYEAWGNQLDANRSEILATYRSETDEGVKLRALKAWAQAYGRTRGTDSFIPQAVHSLEQVAMNDRDPGERRQALLALKALGREESRAALLRISETNSLQRVRDLARSMALSGY